MVRNFRHSSMHAAGIGGAALAGMVAVGTGSVRGIHGAAVFVDTPFEDCILL